MPGNLFPRAGYRMSEATLRRQMGNSPLYEFLRMHASYDRVMLDSFAGINTFPIALDAGYWTVANSGGSSAANFATVVGAGPGYLQGDTGTDDNGSISMIGPVIYQGDLNVGCEFDIQIDDPTEYIFDVGLVAAVPGSNTAAVNDVDTPTAYMTDGAVLHTNALQTETGLVFVTEGSTASMDVKATTATKTTQFTAATRHIVTIQTFGNFAACWIDGKLEAVHDAGVDPQGCLEGGTLLAPWIYCATTESGVARFPRLYGFSIWQDKR